MKNEYTITWGLYQSWAIENTFKGPRLPFTLLWCAAGLAAAVIGSGISPLYLLISAFCFYLAFLKNLLFAKKQYQVLSKVYGGENWVRTIVFEEEQITVTEGTSSTKFSYSDIADIQEKDDKIWIIFHSKAVLRLYQSTFTNVSWALCRSFLSRKCQSMTS